MRQMLIAAFVTVAATASAPADELGWQTYVNPRFGYSVDVPVAYLLPQPAPDNGDGLSFVSAEGDVYLAVWGSNNVSGWSLDRFYREALARPDVGTVTYQRKAADWYVLSGYRTADGGSGPYQAIFYERVAMASGRHTIAGFLILTAPSLKDKIEPIITRISRSLTPPGGG